MKAIFSFTYLIGFVVLASIRPTLAAVPLYGQCGVSILVRHQGAVAELRYREQVIVARQLVLQAAVF